MTSNTGRDHDLTDPDTATAAASAPVREDSADSDLGTALDGLSRLTLGAQSLESSLEWIATLAVVAIPGADGAGVTMLEAGHSETVSASAPFVRQVDDIQYGISEGPCIIAASDGQTVVTGSLTTDPRWPRFGPRTRPLGVHSALSLPLVLPDGEVMGAVNVYARAHDAFAVEAADLGRVFAVAAAVVVNNARELMQARRLADQLRAAMASRATIDQAIGILMSRQGGSPDDALATLKRMSQNQNIKLAVVAAEIVRNAVERARARHSGG